jgi:hypothetical protein
MKAKGPKVDVTYCERWDPERRAIGGPLPIAEARSRHAASEPYAVLLGAPERPRALLEVAGQLDTLTAWCFDRQLRRTFLFEFRMLELGRMALLRMAEWRYADADRPEFDPTSPRTVTTFGSDGDPVAESSGPSGLAFRALTHDDRWAKVPRFGRWSPLARFLLDAPMQRKRHRIVPPTRQEQPAPPGPAWSSELPDEWPTGAQTPGPTVTAFGPPARFALEPDSSGDAPEVVVETRPAGLLLMPTGRLIAADPGWPSPGLEPFTVALPPGRHPVTLAVARFVDKPDHRVAACRVSVRETPVTSWEPALVPGEDPSILGADESFMIGVDAGMLCFFDAAMLPGLVELSEVWDEPRGLWDELADVIGREDSVELEDPKTKTNLIAFRSGWGDGAYPVWIGRCADGDVGCVVADTLVLTGATFLGAAADRKIEQSWKDSDCLQRLD